MKKMFVILSIGIISVFGISCDDAKIELISAEDQLKNSTNPTTILMGSAYELISYNNKPITDSTLNVLLSWDNQNKLFANFCNTLRATAELKTGIVKSVVSSTKMACGNQTLMTIESTFTQGLSEGMTLVLKTNKNNAKQNDLYFTTAKGETFIFEWKAQFME